jgi:hypothetical protein
MNKFHKETLTRLSQQFAQATNDPEEAELRRYFQELYKHSNKGIKGRGKGRKVEVLVHPDELRSGGTDGCHQFQFWSPPAWPVHI